MLLDGCLSNLDSPVSVCGICAAKKSSTVCGFSSSEPTIKEAERVPSSRASLAKPYIVHTYLSRRGKDTAVVCASCLLLRLYPETNE